MKILSADYIRELDKYTIEHEPVSSVDLMERAATACFRRIVKLVDHQSKVFVVCGKGNNGGDGLVISRLLNEANYSCQTLIIEHADEFSPDAQKNFDRLCKRHSKHVFHIKESSDFDKYRNDKEPTIIDALFGTGLNRKAEGIAADAIDFMNDKFKAVISIDIPSGLLADSYSDSRHIVNSTLTLTFQQPKLAFLISDNAKYVPEFEIIDIGLHPEGQKALSTGNYYLTAEFVSDLLRKRNKFSHKGDYGHALLFAGSLGKSGAAVLAARACMRSGAGLLTVHSTSTTLQALLHHLPEAMGSIDANQDFISETGKLETFDAIGFGPGVGDHNDTATVLKKLIQYYNGRMVIDADGLNILAANKTWLEFLPPDTILTPHPREFARLTGKHNDGFERLEALRRFAMRYNCITVLKGAHSAIAMPDGNITFNSSGNAALAKAGTGDGLTGIILGLLARGYPPPQAAIIGTFIHGFAADQLLRKNSMESLLITDIIEQLPKAFRRLESSNK
jgi:ADP-dependent NAD(P)H-hydrate dehydratase / NAD(P)H-hydrate epimerase